MKVSSLYVLICAVVFALFGNSSVHGQGCTPPHAFAPPGLSLRDLSAPTQPSYVFTFGHFGSNQTLWMGPGTYTSSGTLNPGRYWLELEGDAYVSSFNSPDCDEICTASLQFTLSNPVALVTAVPPSFRAVSVAAGGDPMPQQANSITSNSGSFQDAVNRNGNWQIHPGCHGVTFAEASMTVSVVGSPTAQTQWNVQGTARTSQRGLLGCVGVNGSESLGVFRCYDIFDVSVPTNFTVNFTTTEESGSTGVPSAGSSQSIPVLPLSSSSSDQFEIDNAPTGGWGDPPLAYGYTYQILGTSNFTRIAEFPVGIDGDGMFEVRVGGAPLGIFPLGTPVDFVTITGAPVPSFEVLGITPLVDGSSPVAFPIKLDFDTPTASYTMTAINMVAPIPYCFGDGTSTACPCGNAGAAGNGCASSINSSGANLSFDGVTSVLDDSLVLNATGTSDSSVLYFQGTTQIAATFGDGLRCAGGTVIRIGSSVASSGVSHYPGTGGTPVSVKGAIPSGGGGVTRNYQAWYRNAASFCTPSTFNLTNGLSVTWTQ